MTWNEIKERLKSPVVIIQIISIVVGVLVYFKPDLSEQIKVVSGAIIGIINIFAGLNNPTDKNNF